MNPPSIAVIGSVNLDIVARGAKLPTPGETVTGATLARHPGGKGANQALAARRIGAEVRLIACVGADAAAEEALALLRAGGVDLGGLIVEDAAPTGVALIAVAPDGENQIIVAPGANAAFTPARLGPIAADAILCQLEIPIETVAKAAAGAPDLFCVNLAPAADVPDEILRRADLIIVNDTEAAFYGARLRDAGGLLAITHGARGASLLRDGVKIAEAAPPRVAAVDATGAGDAFVAALVVAVIEGRPHAESLRFACAAGAAAARAHGAQPSLPMRAAVEALAAEK